VSGGLQRLGAFTSGCQGFWWAIGPGIGDRSPLDRLQSVCDLLMTRPLVALPLYNVDQRIEREIADQSGIRYAWLGWLCGAISCRKSFKQSADASHKAPDTRNPVLPRSNLAARYNRQGASVFGAADTPAPPADRASNGKRVRERPCPPHRQGEGRIGPHANCRLRHALHLRPRGNVAQNRLKCADHCRQQRWDAATKGDSTAQSGGASSASEAHARACGESINDERDSLGFRRSGSLVRIVGGEATTAINMISPFQSGADERCADCANALLGISADPAFHA
jgi:hypothetical protein